MLDTIALQAPPAVRRTLPMRKPGGHVPPVPRWRVDLGYAWRLLTILYAGAQARDDAVLAASGFRPWLETQWRAEGGPYSWEWSRYVDAAGCVNLVCVAYWVDEDRFSHWKRAAGYEDWWRGEPDGVGRFRELMRVPPERLENNYSKPDYKVGFARYEPSGFVGHEETGYWGAMRDRIPLSAADPFDPPAGTMMRPQPWRGPGRWRVELPGNLAVIRSGQHWEDCEGEQLDNYLRNLQPALDAGMRHLVETPMISGCCSLRYMQNIGPDGSPRRESCGLGHFLSLAHLEAWAEAHPTHHAIYHRAIDTAKRYGAGRQLRTWHEVFVLPTGGQEFEYVNCHESTGLLPWCDAQRTG